MPTFDDQVIPANWSYADFGEWVHATLDEPSVQSVECFHQGAQLIARIKSTGSARRAT